MKKHIKIIIGFWIFFAGIAVLPVHAHAQELDVSSNDMIDKAAVLDGKTVTYTGEAVGDVMYRGSHAWVNVSDGKNAVGVYVTSDEAAEIKITGKYRVKGDTVKVRGVFHRACRQHGGDMDIHAQLLSVTESGYYKKDRPSAVLTAAAVTALLLAVSGTAFTIKKYVV
jgi:hypothetical protein